MSAEGFEEEEIFVDFEKHCCTCKNEKVEECEEPCNTCLEHPANLYTDRPVNWKARE